MQEFTYLKNSYIAAMNNGFCVYCETQTMPKIIFETTGKTTVDIFEEFSMRGMNCDGSRWTYYDMEGRGCCTFRLIRTLALEFRKEKKYKKILRKWERFLRGERGVLTKESGESNSKGEFGFLNF